MLAISRLQFLIEIASNPLSLKFREVLSNSDYSFNKLINIGKEVNFELQ